MDMGRALQGCRRTALKAVTTAVAVVMLAETIPAAEPPYREYRPASRKRQYFEISIDDSYLKVTAPSDGNVSEVTVPVSAVAIQDDRVTVGDMLVFDSTALRWGDRTFPYDRIWDSYIHIEDARTTITFYIRPGADRARLMRRGNLIAPMSDIAVDEGRFVRGLVFSVSGDITVAGEVNTDVISLFGSVEVLPTAVIRGDIATLTGKVRISRRATVYGESITRGGKSVSHRFGRIGKNLSTSVSFRYNRVDGAAPRVGLRFADADSLLPFFRVDLGRGVDDDRRRGRAAVQRRRIDEGLEG